MVAEIDPPKMMITACSEMNMWRSPPSSIIVAMTMVPATMPAPVMISMGDSNAYATHRPSWPAARPNPEPRSETLKGRH